MIRNPANPLSGGEKGAVVVLVAVFAVGLLALAALAIDIGMIYSRRATLQCAADAAALAAAYTVTTQKINTIVNNLSQTNTQFAAAIARGNQVAALNEPLCNTPTYEWGRWSNVNGFIPISAGSQANAVRVTVTMEQRYFLGQIFMGAGATKTVSARAVACFLPTGGNVWPLGIPTTRYAGTKRQPADNSPINMSGGTSIAFGPNPSNLAPGNKGWISFNNNNDSPSLRVYLEGGPYTESCPDPWQALSGLNQLSSNGTEDYALNILEGNTGSISVKGSTGLASTLQSIVEQWCNEQRIVLLPIYDSAPTGTGSNTYYRVVGLLPVQLMSYVDLDNFSFTVLPSGPIYFPTNSIVADAVETDIVTHDTNLTLCQ